MLWFMVNIITPIQSNGWQVQEPANVTRKGAVQSLKYTGFSISQQSWGHTSSQEGNMNYECGHCGQVCCNYNGNLYCVEPGAICDSVGEEGLPELRCVCSDNTPPACGHLGEPCCPPYNTCGGSLQCINNTCYYPGCGHLGEPCCSGNVCNNPLTCINNTCQYSGSDETLPTCGSFYTDINGSEEGGELYVVDQSDTLSTEQKRLPSVFLVHGMGSDCSAWSDYVNWFYEFGYRIGNASMYRQDYQHVGDCISDYTLFCPNGRMLKTLVDIYDSLISARYPEEDGWNNSIVAVAHSRGALDIENAIVFQNLQNVSGIISLGTPWWGSTMADLCLNPPPAISLPLCAAVCKLNPLCMYVCMDISVPAIRYACVSSNPDALILNTGIMRSYRILVHLLFPNIQYFGGIGYDLDLLCRNFTENYTMGCFLIRFFTGNYINDGAVNGSSVYAMNWVYGNKFIIFSRYTPWPLGDPFTGRGFPDPEEWRVDHSRVIHSYDIFEHVEDITREFVNTNTSHSTSPVDSQALAEILERARTVESKGYMDLIFPGDTIRILVGGTSGVSSLSVISTARIRSNIPWEDLSGTCDSCTIKSRILFRSTSPRTVWITSPDSGLVLFGFEEDTTIHFKLSRDRLIYLRGQTARFTLYLPPSIMQFKAYYKSSGLGSTDEVRNIDFEKERPGIYKARITDLKTGYYSIVVHVDDSIYKRTLIMPFMVIDANSPFYDLVTSGDIPPDTKTGSYEKRSNDLPKKTLIIHNDRIMISQLELPLKTTRTQYYIYNLSGKLVKSGILYEKHIDVRSLEPGIYILKVSGKVYKLLIR